MKQPLVYIAAGILALSAAGAPLRAGAQETPTSPPAGAVYSEAQLDQLLAPVALYPDALLSQVLMAATYPLEVIEAARWVRDPHNASLKGEALTRALGEKDWAPSVKSLVPFPQVLDMMDTHLDWMQNLGDAFLAREADVMNAVQRLRSRAVAAGNLHTGDEMAVVPEGRTIVIRPANPGVIYVPVYDPLVVFGAWPYPAYPPFYFPLPPGYIVAPTLTAGFYFSTGIVTVNWLWGWGYFDWPRHRIHIDVHRFNVINRRRPPITRDVWVHNRYHRRGVPYPSPSLRSRFAPVRPRVPAPHRDFRGFEPRPRAVPQVTPPRTGEPRRPPPAFQDFSSGADARRDAERGRTSRRDMSPRRPAPSREERAPRRGATPDRRSGTGDRRHENRR